MASGRHPDHDFTAFPNEANGVPTRLSGTENTEEQAPPNPVLVCCAGAGYETCRALRLFMGETSKEAKLQFSQLSSNDRSLMIDDALQVISGAPPPELQARYSDTPWGEVDPVEKIMWAAFCAAVSLQLQAVKQIAVATQLAPETDTKPETDDI